MTRRPGDRITKDPISDEPEGFDWTTYLAELGSGTTIVTSTWTITGDDSALTQHDASILAGSQKTQVYLAGGTLDAQYQVTNKIVTSTTPPVMDERSFFITMVSK